MKQRYTDKEIGALIQRATELQEASNVSSEEHLTLEEIEHIAAEMGIDPRHLRTAAIEMEGGNTIPSTFRLLGGPFSVDQTRLVEGAVTEEQWEQVVLEARRLTGNVGQVSTFGQAKEWRHAIDKGLAYTHVTLHPKGDQTAIQVGKQYRGGALVAYMLAAVFSVTIAGIFMDGSGISDLNLNIVLCMSLLTAFLATRMALGFWTKRQQREVEQLADGVSRIIQPDSLIKERQQADIVLDLSEAQEPQPTPAASRRGIRA